MSPFEPHANHSKFDYYTASIPRPKDFEHLIKPTIKKLLPSDTIAESCTPNKPFLDGLALVDPEILNKSKSTILKISKGGDHVNGTIQLESKGGHAPVLNKILTESRAFFLPTRVDVAIDWFENGLFDCIAASAIAFAQDRKKPLKIGYAGDWARGESRTLYIGSRKSEIFLRIYEKGYKARQDGDLDAPLNWVRVEPEFKFQSFKKRMCVSGFTPSQFFQIGWIKEFTEYLMFNTESIPLPSSYKAPDYDRALRALKRQYGKTLEKLAQDMGYDEKRFMAALISSRVA